MDRKFTGARSLLLLRSAVAAASAVVGRRVAIARDDVKSDANFYAQTSDGECGLE